MNICFTGPRPNQLFGYESLIPYEEQIITPLMKCLEQYHGAKFITGGAQGFDMCAFWAARRLHEYTSVYVPFEGQASRWSEYGVFGQADYFRMLELADEVQMLSGIPRGDDVGRLLHVRNQMMVNDSDFVIALLHGRSERWESASGGTSSCVRYAVHMCKRVLVMRIGGGFEWL